MAYQGVTLKGTVPANDLTFVLNSDITASDVGKVVTQDTAAANRVKLAGAGDPILGRLESYEDRVIEGVKVGAVKIIGGMELPIAEGYTPAVGDTVIGAAGGLVTKVGTGESSDLVVWEKTSSSVIVVKTH